MKSQPEVQNAHKEVSEPQNREKGVGLEFFLLFLAVGGPIGSAIFAGIRAGNVLGIATSLIIGLGVGFGNACGIRAISGAFSRWYARFEQQKRSTKILDRLGGLALFVVSMWILFSSALTIMITNYVIKY